MYLKSQSNERQESCRYHWGFEPIMNNITNLLAFRQKKWLASFAIYVKKGINDNYTVRRTEKYKKGRSQNCIIYVCVRSVGIFELFEKRQNTQDLPAHNTSMLSRFAAACHLSPDLLYFNLFFYPFYVVLFFSGRISCTFFFILFNFFYNVVE